MTIALAFVLTLLPATVFGLSVSTTLPAPTCGSDDTLVTGAVGGGIHDIAAMSDGTFIYAFRTTAQNLRVARVTAIGAPIWSADVEVANGPRYVSVSRFGEEANWALVISESSPSSVQWDGYMSYLEAPTGFAGKPFPSSASTCSGANRAMVANSVSANTLAVALCGFDGAAFYFLNDWLGAANGPFNVGSGFVETGTYDIAAMRDGTGRFAVLRESTATNNVRLHFVASNGTMVGLSDNAPLSAHNSNQIVVEATNNFVIGFSQNSATSTGQCNVWFNNGTLAAQFDLASSVPSWSASTALENTIVFAWYAGGSNIFVATLVDAGVDELNYAPEQPLAQPEITDVVAVSVAPSGALMALGQRTAFGNVYRTTCLLAVVTVGGAECVSLGEAPWSVACIQRGIDLAATGAEVLLAPGVYTGCDENGIVIEDKSLRLATSTTANGTGEVAVIDCEASGRAFILFSYFADHSVDLADIEVRNAVAGEGAALAGYGGQPAVRRATVTRCVVRNCTASRGGAMFFGAYNPVLTNSTFEGNTASVGGAVYGTDSTPVEAWGSSFVGNVATGGGGGGLTVDGGGLMHLVDSVFSGNSALFGGGAYLGQNGLSYANNIIKTTRFEDNEAVNGGGGLSLASATAVSNCTFAGNVAGSYGGGLAVLDGTAAGILVLSGTEFVGNRATDGGGLHSSTTVDVTNCTFAGNTAAGNGGGAAFPQGACDRLVMTVSNSSFRANAAGGAGGGIFSNSIGLSLIGSLLRENWASDGGGLAVICRLSLCWRDIIECPDVITRLDGNTIVNNLASVSGGGLYANERELDDDPLAVGINVVAGNRAGAGGGVFVASPLAMTFTDLSRMDLNGNMLARGGYGTNVAAPAVSLWWEVPPLATAMSGTPLCEADGGAPCRIGLGDVFNNTVTSPAIVGLESANGSDMVLVAPEFVLVSAGSAVIESMRVQIASDSGAVGPVTINVAIAVVETGAAVVGAGTSDVTLSLAATPCDAGYGADPEAAGNTVACVPCALGFYSGAPSLEPCRSCPAGEIANTTRATACVPCAEGYDATAGGTFCTPGADLLNNDGSGEAATVVSGGLATWLLLLIVGLALCLVACALVGVYWWSRRRVITKYYIDEDATVSVDEAFLQRKIERCLKRHGAKRIGGGEFTDIFRVKEGKDVFALKILKREAKDNGTARAECIREAQILALLTTKACPHILRMRFFTSNAPVAIALDYAPHGSLKVYLRRAAITPMDRLRFASEVATGMRVVHANGIAHLDLKTANVLIDAKRRAVVADFGISVRASDFGPADLNPVFGYGASSRAEAGDGIEMGSMAPSAMARSSVGGTGSVLLAFTPQYCAPERLARNDLSFEELQRGDQFSFGVLVWALYTLTEPYLDLSADEVVAAKKSGRLARLDLPTWMPAPVCDMVEATWGEAAGERPSFLELEAELTALLAAEVDAIAAEAGDHSDDEQ